MLLVQHHVCSVTQMGGFRTLCSLLPASSSCRSLVFSSSLVLCLICSWRSADSCSLSSFMAEILDFSSRTTRSVSYRRRAKKNTHKNRLEILSSLRSSYTRVPATSLSSFRRWESGAVAIWLICTDVERVDHSLVPVTSEALDDDLRENPDTRVSTTSSFTFELVVDRGLQARGREGEHAWLKVFGVEVVGEEGGGLLGAGCGRFRRGGVSRGHGEDLGLELQQLTHETEVGRDDCPALLDDVEGLIQPELLRPHDVGHADGSVICHEALTFEETDVRPARQFLPVGRPVIQSYDGRYAPLPKPEQGALIRDDKVQRHRPSSRPPDHH
ncbi:hypothetical protein EYF80_027642 [Liparis tanakae]|uniref:Uncharacterized protein n=1 Tax=Liparis tanakae TaxID=230148 RepID=A0A4Z2HBJ4_9TELE|nr:hypothetical protein EYF80_027642 [Liparis tanakae]